MELEGLVVPSLTLFDAQGEVDGPSNARFARDLQDEGIRHIFVLGSLGEFPGLDFEERSRLLEAVVESCTFPSDVWSGVGAPSTKLALAFADQAETLGASVLVATPPYYLHPDAFGLRDYYRSLRRQTRLPLLAYNIPSLVGYALEPGLVHELATEGVLNGIKDTSGSLDSIRSFLRGAPEGFAVLPGDDPLVLPALKEGAAGGIMGTANVLPRLDVEFMDAARKKDWVTAEKLHDLIQGLHALFFRAPFPSSVKFLAQYLRQTPVGYRSPYLPLTEEQQNRLKEDLRRWEDSFRQYV
jgi:dihydrodipicolinate synthase/N-acetylneuraminate lyase